MQEFLLRRNQELLHKVQELVEAIEQAQVPAELEPYREHVRSICSALREPINLSLSHLELNQSDILEDVLSNTKQITEWVNLISSRLAIPILRASSTDRLSLYIIGWLHRGHSETVNYPPAFANGVYSILPFQLAPIYFVPVIEQKGLLYQPLLFHEYGHLLYICYKPEMDDLVSDLKQEVIDLLRPISQRNDQYSKVQANKRQIIADTWYKWTQELFCDAVGFEIGGPCFLYAFSSFLGSLDEADFRRQSDDLWMSSHPVSWLRVRFLTERAKKRGFSDLADIIWDEWCMTAEVMGLTEDYHGFYHDSLAQPVNDTLEDMLEEANPRKYTEPEVTGDNWEPTTDSPVRLLNWAWQVYKKSPETYVTWETEKLKYFFETSNGRTLTQQLQLRQLFHKVLGS
jgi:hypothetical protein